MKHGVQAYATDSTDSRSSQRDSLTPGHSLYTTDDCRLQSYSAQTST